MQKEKPQNNPSITRKWFHSLSSRTHNFSIISYNILAECNILAHHFKTKDLENLKIMARLQLITNELEQIPLDIICLQEVDCFFVENLNEWAKSKNLGSVFQKKGTSDKPEGCMTLFNRDRFEFVRKYHCHLGIEKNINYFSVPNDSLISTKTDLD